MSYLKEYRRTTGNGKKEGTPNETKHKTIRNKQSIDISIKQDIKQILRRATSVLFRVSSKAFVIIQKKKRLLFKKAVQTKV